MDRVHSPERPHAVLFDFSGTLFRLEEDDSWFSGITLADGADLEVDRHVRVELMHRMTAPTGRHVPMGPAQLHAWENRDLEPALHREAYLHVLRESGVADHHAESLYRRLTDPASWTPYPDTVDVLRGLASAGVKVAVVSNIAYDIRPAFAGAGVDRLIDEFVLSFEVGAVKPDPLIFETALSRLGVAAGEAMMVGDSDEADGAARDLGLRFALVDPLPTAQRPDGLRRALQEGGLHV